MTPDNLFVFAAKRINAAWISDPQQRRGSMFTARASLLIWSICAGLICFGTSVAENIIWPANCKVVDITKSPYSADNTGKTDVTAILNNAIDKECCQPTWLSKWVYLPNGTYLVRGTVKWRTAPSVGPFLQGQSKAGTVIRLADGTWTSAGLNYVLNTGLGASSADCFNRGIRNLTINIGKNNAGASGILFFSNNEGIISDVDIISEDGNGTIGLSVTQSMNGPNLVRNLYVKGFSYGVQTNALSGVTLLNTTVENQKTCGVYCSGSPLWIDGLVSNNKVRAVRNNGQMVLVDAVLNGGDAATDAISNEGGGWIFLRKISASGYKRALSCVSTSVPAASIPQGTTITGDFSSHGSKSLFPSAASALNLPKKLPPDPEWEQDMSKWALVSTYKTTGRTDVQAFQAAIDDVTKTSIALDMNLTFNADVHVRNNIKLIVSTFSGWFKNGTANVIVDEGTAPVVKFLNIDYYRPDINGAAEEVPVCMVQRSSRTVIYESAVDWDLYGEGSGDIFVLDAPIRIKLSNAQQHLWTWHFNGETWMLGQEFKMSAGTARLFGWKAEHENTKVITTGGTLEMLGFLMYSPTNDSRPLISVTNTEFSCAMLTQIGNPYNLVVRETRNGVTKDLTGGGSAALFLGNTVTVGINEQPRVVPYVYPKDSRLFIYPSKSRNAMPRIPESERAFMIDIRGRVIATSGSRAEGAGLLFPAILPRGVYSWWETTDGGQ